MQTFVMDLDTSVSDPTPETRIYRLRLKPFEHIAQLDCSSAELYSRICYQVNSLGDWITVRAAISDVAKLKVAGLVDVRVEG